jgi:hypothetical protein
VDLLYPYVVDDAVTIRLAPGLVIESLPTNTKVPLGQFALYQAIYKDADGTYSYRRQMALGTPIYKASEYAQLRDFFQKSGAQDQAQLILKRAATEANASAPAGKSE